MKAIYWIIIGIVVVGIIATIVIVIAQGKAAQCLGSDGKWYVYETEKGIPTICTGRGGAEGIVDRGEGTDGSFGSF